MNFLRLRFGLILISLIFCNIALAQTCQVLDKALKYYNNGEFEQILLLNTPLDKIKTRKTGCTEEKIIELWRLKAEAYAVTGDIENAKRTIAEILQISQNFQPNYTHSERFQTLFEWVKRSNKNELITSVSKSSDSLYLAPAHISIITATEIMQRGYQHFGELFYDIAGIDVSEVAGTATVYARGIRTPEHTEGILLMVDGVSQNAIWTQEIFLNGLFPLNNIKRVEIIYGSQSAIYGTEAFNGVINIVTKTVDDLLPNQEKIGGTGSISRNIELGNDNVPNERIDMEASVMMDLNYKTSLSFFVKNSTEDRTNLLRSQFNTAYIPKPLAIYGSIYSQVPSDVLTEARTLDSIAYNTIDSVTSAITDNVYWNYGAKLSIDKFELGGSYFYYTEEQGEMYKDRRSFGVLSNNRRINEGAFYFKYNQFVTNNLHINIYSNYQVENILFNYARLASFATAQRASIHEPNLKAPHIIHRTYSAHSYEFTNEVNLNYHFSNYLETQMVLEYKTGGVQGNYLIEDGQYHAFSEDFDPQDYNFQSYLNDNLAAHFHISYRVPSINTLILTADLRTDYFRTRPNSYSYRKDKYYSNYATYFHTNYYSPANVINDNFYEYVDTTDTNEPEFLPQNFQDKLDNYRGIYSPRLSIVYSNQWRKRDYLTFKLIYAEGFKTVSQFQRLGNIANNVLNNPFNYSPSESKEFSFQTKYQSIRPKHKVDISVAGYYIDIQNLIDLSAPLPIENRDHSIIGTDILNYITYNLNFQKVKGGFVEWNYLYHLNKTDDISIFGNYAYTNAEIEGFDVASIASHKLNIGLNISLFKKKFNFNIRANRVGTRPITDHDNFEEAGDIPAYTKVNTALTYHWHNTGLSLQLSVNNLLNTTFYHNGIGPEDGAVYKNRILQDGRMLSARVYYDLNKSKVVNKIISFLK